MFEKHLYQINDGNAFWAPFWARFRCEFFDHFWGWNPLRQRVVRVVRRVAHAICGSCFCAFSVNPHGSHLRDQDRRSPCSKEEGTHADQVYIFVVRSAISTPVFGWNLWWFELIEDAFWRLGLCKLAATFVLAAKLCLWVAVFCGFAVFEKHFYQINCVYAFWAPF